MACSFIFWPALPSLAPAGQARLVRACNFCERPLIRTSRKRGSGIKPLEGELAVANGELEKAAAAFSAGEPTGRMPSGWQFGSLSIPANSLL